MKDYDWETIGSSNTSELYDEDGFDSNSEYKSRLLDDYEDFEDEEESDDFDSVILD